MIRWMALLLLASPAMAAEPAVFFQSHRGGMNEVPENTLAALEHSWAIPGAVPEVDLRTTRDGVIICLHDATLERTTNAAPPDASIPVKQMDYEQVSRWDAGVRFNERYQGERVPRLDEVFSRMKERPERQINLDLKAVSLEAVVAMIDAHGLREQVWWVHGQPSMCEKLAALWPGSRVMTWISDPPETLKRRFDRMAARNFHGVSLLQFHLRPVESASPIRYELDDAYLKNAVETLASKGVRLQVRPFAFDAESLRRLTGLGIRWFVTDEPKAFREALTEAGIP